MRSLFLLFLFWLSVVFLSDSDCFAPCFIAALQFAFVLEMYRNASAPSKTVIGRETFWKTGVTAHGVLPVVKWKIAVVNCSNPGGVKKKHVL